MRTVNPKTNLIDYGPKQLVFDLDGRIKDTITPDEVVGAAAGVTYKDTRFYSDAILKRINGDFGEITIEGYRKDLMGLINSAGQGHASLATTPYLWVSVEGDASKMVDSLFTGAKYGSFLMPSSRRVPIEKDAIVVPRGIIEKGHDAIDLYMKASEANIDAYEQLQSMGIPKEEAAKIVQYGHLGGGILSFPLETIIGLRRQFDRNGNATPREGLEILSHLEKIIRQNGMIIGYTARLLSPRETCPNPDIFHNRNTEATTYGEGNSPEVVDFKANMSNELISRLENFRERVMEAYSSEDEIKKNWRDISGELQTICADFPLALSTSIHSTVPWRVWGEIKRHRTMPQSSESIYGAAQRALSTIERIRNNTQDAKDIGNVVSLRSCITKNPEAEKLWTKHFMDSMDTYRTLTTEMDINPADAIYLVPRGLKLKVIKELDTWNIVQGYIPLRLCRTAEGEMREGTEREMELIKKFLPTDVGIILGPKCQITGHCHDGIKGRSCDKIQETIPLYTPEFDKKIKTERKENIISKINNPQ